MSRSGPSQLHCIMRTASCRSVRGSGVLGSADGTASITRMIISCPPLRLASGAGGRLPPLPRLSEITSGRSSPSCCQVEFALVSADAG
eukprot:1262028-Pyramimonas_sp.AAC.1